MPLQSLDEEARRVKKTIELTWKERNFIATALTYRSVELRLEMKKGQEIMDEVGWTESDKAWLEARRKEKEEADRLYQIFAR